MIAGRVGPLRRDLVRVHVPHQLVRAFLGLLLIIGDINQRQIGQPVERRHPAMHFGPVFAITVKDRADTRITGKKHRPDIFIFYHRRGAGPAASGNPDRGMRLLIGAGPDIDLAALEPAPFEIERPVMGRPAFQNQVMCFPDALAAPDGGPVRRRRFKRHAAHKPAIKTAL